MTASSRRPLAALLCACALAVGGCAAPGGGLGAGTPAPPVSPQPHPEPLWSARDSAPGAAVGRQEPPPTPLKNAPEAGADGLLGVDPTEVARADRGCGRTSARAPPPGRRPGPAPGRSDPAAPTRPAPARTRRESPGRRGRPGWRYDRP
ncbi:hypothetical protein PV721_27015 [Streptomyces sp. MB09-01]|uniref:hypothetical protein n=1 Tax=Streptomyces sp. MB09-01 TaxID=3028666 RepID=UPI0029A5DAF4|nr:hypothetical protein [Streptomyces sp. MB09-01]MDX3537935.1 hypothetical protein [Streptomyces sp. MB09-01]